jgi:hypothetical protein
VQSEWRKISANGSQHNLMRHINLEWHDIEWLAAAVETSCKCWFIITVQQVKWISWCSYRNILWSVNCWEKQEIQQQIWACLQLWSQNFCPLNWSYRKDLLLTSDSLSQIMCSQQYSVQITLSFRVISWRSKIEMETFNRQHLTSHHWYAM